MIPEDRTVAVAAFANLPDFGSGSDRSATRLILIAQEFSYLSQSELIQLTFHRWVWRQLPVEDR